MGERPAGRPWHAATQLDHFCIVTWAMQPERLARALPAGLAPQVFEVQGRECSLASAVAFEDRDFHFKGCPLAQISCGQINYRAYVRRGEKTGVYFLRTVLGSRWAVVRSVFEYPPLNTCTIVAQHPSTMRQRLEVQKRLYMRQSLDQSFGSASRDNTQQPCDLKPEILLSDNVCSSWFLLFPFLCCFH